MKNTFYQIIGALVALSPVAVIAKIPGTDPSDTEYTGLSQVQSKDIQIKSQLEGITDAKNVSELITTFTNIFVTLLGMISMIVLIYGGFLYLLAAGDSAKAEKGATLIRWAIIGIIIVLVSYSLVTFLTSGVIISK